MRFKAREGDFIETSESLMFDVKGLIHPPNRIIAFLRYFPDERGERKRNSERYSKVYSLSKRYALLENRFPQYLVHNHVFDVTLCEVPVDAVKRHYKPAQKLQELRSSSSLDELENLALQLAKQLKENANVPWDAIGISGSIMARLHKPSSDIDVIVYGSKNCRKVYSTMGNLLGEKQGPFKPYTRRGLKALFDFRSKDTAISFDDFVRSESRKVLQGRFRGTDYFIRFVKDWSEIKEKYGEVQYVNVGYARIKATVADDSESIFTPCAYNIDDVHVFEGNNFPITEIASFRGRFCEQARNGEVVIAQGKVEQVIDNKQNCEHFRLLMGNKPSDYFVTVPKP
jgi:predicted nucleotidyltransferase